MGRLTFTEIGTSESGKTKIWEIVGNNFALGRVAWYGQWRKYVFFPGAGIIFDAGCLDEVGAFLVKQTSLHRLK